MEAQRMIGETRYSIGFLLDVLTENHENFGNREKESEIEKVEETLISKDRGFGSNIYSVKLTSAEGKAYSVVCKIPTAQHLNDHLQICNSGSKSFSEEEVRVQKEINITQVIETHNREVDFYRFAKKKFPRSLKIPRFIYGKYMSETKEGIAIMEDLSGKFEKGPSSAFSKTEALTMVDSICELQVQCLLNQDFVERNFRPVESLVKCIKGFTLLAVDDLLKNENYTWFTQDHADKISALADFDKLLEVMASMLELGMPPVVCHGDLWPTNILWQSSGNGSRDLLAIIDWQDCYIGNYATDLASILAVNMDFEMRKLCEKEILEYYVDRMNAYKENYNLNIDLTYEKVHLAYKKALQVSVLLIMSLLGNPEDVVDYGDGMGRLTRRLMHMLEDVEYE